MFIQSLFNKFNLVKKNYDEETTNFALLISNKKLHFEDIDLTFVKLGNAV